MISLHETSGSAVYYKQGVIAQREGRQMWECPYVTFSDERIALGAWLAGWMWSKQQEAKQ